MSYAPHSSQSVSEMLKSIGISSIEELYKDIPDDVLAASCNLPHGLSEYEVLKQFKEYAAKNSDSLVQFAGGGFYDHYVPPAVDYIASRGEFYTAYTPYQPEASQGTLQALYEYQTAVCELTGMDVSNASLYDGGTALIEAILMTFRKTKKQKVIVDRGVNPVYIQMLETSCRHRDYEIVYINCKGISTDMEALDSAVDERTAAVVVENPNFFGEINDFSVLAEAVHQNKALFIMSVYPVSLGILKTPEEMGADIVTAEGQSLGNYLNFGGPYLGIIASREKLIRGLPGRIAGKTIDTRGRDAYVLTLQAREQHIRRQKATSNICSNQNLCALRSLVFLSLLGPDGMRDLAVTNHSSACYMKEQLEKINGVTVENNSFFNTMVISLPKDAENVYSTMLQKNISFGIPLHTLYPSDAGMKNRLLVTVTEKRSENEIDTAAKTLAEALA